MHRQTDRQTHRNKLITITLSYRRALTTFKRANISVNYEDVKLIEAYLPVEITQLSTYNNQQSRYLCNKIHMSQLWQLNKHWDSMVKDKAAICYPKTVRSL